jgi:hypothetical protein
LNLAALDAVAKRLREHDVPFLLGGSGLLFALGIDVPVRDIDLMLRPDDRERFEAAVGDWLVTVTTDPGPVLTSEWKATLEVLGTEVEGLGGLGFAGGPVLPFRSEGEWRGVPLAAPEIWWAAYRAHKPDRAALLEPFVSPSSRSQILGELGQALGSALHGGAS